LPKSHWDRKKARVDYERALYRFEVEQEKTQQCGPLAHRAT
jgi:hypothetical protein